MLVVITWEYAVIVVVLVGEVWAVVAMASILEKAWTFWLMTVVLVVMS